MTRKIDQEILAGIERCWRHQEANRPKQTEKMKKRLKPELETKLVISKQKGNNHG
jgi:hypothetical protein